MNFLGQYIEGHSSLGDMEEEPGNLGQLQYIENFGDHLDIQHLIEGILQKGIVAHPC